MKFASDLWQFHDFFLSSVVFSKLKFTAVILMNYNIKHVYPASLFIPIFWQCE
jgi:hypothetical protein